MTAVVHVQATGAAFEPWTAQPDPEGAAHAEAMFLTAADHVEVAVWLAGHGYATRPVTHGQLAEQEIAPHARPGSRPPADQVAHLYAQNPETGISYLLPIDRWVVLQPQPYARSYLEWVEPDLFDQLYSPST